MSTVHKHFPITSRPGGSWGQGATGGLNPLWEEQEKKKKRRRGGFKESNKQFEWKISTSSHVQTLVFALEMPPSLVPDGGADSRLPVPTGPPAHASVIMVTMDRGSFGSLQQALSGLSGPSFNYTLRTWEEPITSPLTDQWRPAGGPSDWCAVRHVAAGVCPLTCWSLLESLFRRISLRRSSHVCDFMSTGEVSEDQMQMRPCQLFPEANC